MDSHYPSEDYPAIILENSSSSCRAGFAGHDAPMSAFPNMIGSTKSPCNTSPTSSKSSQTFIGHGAQDQREILSLFHPVQHGVVTDWEAMEKVLNFTFYSELQASPEQHPVLVTDLPLSSRGSQEKTAEMMFETYKAPAFFLAYEPVLVLYSSGKCDGAVVNCGEGVTYVSPIIGGNLVASARRIDQGGGELTNQLQQLLFKKGLTFTTSSELDVLREIKEELCYIRTEPSAIGDKQSFKLPDGSHVTLDSERHECPEILFSSDGLALPDIVSDVLNDCGPDEKAILRDSVVLAGGTTLLDNFKSRLETELVALSPKAEQVYVSASPERRYHVWIGASIMASLSTFNQMWITRQDYLEFGPHVLHRKYLK